MKRALAGLSIAIVALSAPARVHAYASATGGRGLFDVRSADVPAQGAIDVQASGLGYGATESNGLGRRDVKVVDSALQLDVGVLGYGEVWGSFGTAMLNIPDQGYRAYSVRDGRAGLKVGTTYGRFVPGLAVETSLPWGVHARGFGTGAAEPAITGLLTVHLPEMSPFTGANVHLNVGWRKGRDERGRGFEGWPLYYLEPVYPADARNRIDLRAALELTGRRTTLFAELLLDQLQNDELAFSESPIFLTPGFRFAFTESFSLLVASKIALASDDPSTTRYKVPEDLYPNWQLGFALAWSYGAQSATPVHAVRPSHAAIPPSPETSKVVTAPPSSTGTAKPDSTASGTARGTAAPAGPPAPGSQTPPAPAGNASTPNGAAAVPPPPAPPAGTVPPGVGPPGVGPPGVGPSGAQPSGESASTASPEGARRLAKVTWDGAAVAPKPASYFDLNQLAESMLRDQNLSVEIRVVSEESAESKGRLGLATLRAEYLKAFLVAAGIGPERIHATGVKSETAGTDSSPVPRAEVVTVAPAPAPAPSH